jgi:DNA-directed RNA polymerase subunit RPC12/RpoP
MQGTRCPSCGETRWHLTTITVARATECPVCGTEVLPERRMPGRSRVARSSERRQTDEIPAIRLDPKAPTAA